MKRLFKTGAVALALAAAPAAHAATFNIGDPNFQITFGTPFTPVIVAQFFNGYTSSQAFDDTFLFTIPQNGIGSGSISTSFSGSNMLVITDLIVNGTSYGLQSTPGAGQSRVLGGIPIFNGVQNSINVKGFVLGAGIYTGTATFTAVPVPEPAAWALMVGGFAIVGAAVRRRRTMKVSFS